MYSKKEKLLIFLSMFELSVKKQEEILDFLEECSIEELLNSSQVVDILNKETFHKMVGSYNAREFDNSLENMKKASIEVLAYDNENYPAKLRDLPERPLLLYAKGNLGLLNKPSLAVVGTRKPSNYGKIVTARLVEDVAKAGVVVVSGLCYGVDEIAHRKALEVGGDTIAVVGGGFNNIYPSTNTALSKEIAENGLLLSEYPPSFKAKRYTFPMRNRILAGLSDGVLITEAGMKSGTNHTREFASYYGRDLYAVPGNITSDASALTNYVIKMGEAHCVVEADDILKDFSLSARKGTKKVIALSFDEQLIVDLLQDGEHNFDYLAEKSKISVNILNSCLTTLEIRGLIRKLPGQIYALC